MKIGFTRNLALELLQSLNEGDEDDRDFDSMNDSQLADELCLSGFIHDDDMAGVFAVVPSNVLDAEVQSRKTGWPVSV